MLFRSNSTANVQVVSTAGVGPAVATGRRMGSLNAFAGTHSFNPASGTTFYTYFNPEGTDSPVQGTANVWQVGGSITAGPSMSNNGEYLGSSYYSYTGTLQQFAPSLYKQLVTAAEQRFNAKIRTIVCPTSLRTHLSEIGRAHV